MPVLLEGERVQPSGRRRLQLEKYEGCEVGHGPELQKRIQATFGRQPEFQYFETPIIIDNTTNQVIDEAA